MDEEMNEPNPYLIFTVEHLIAALQATRTLRYLWVNFYACEQPTPEKIRGVVEPLCRCIANLRQHNQNHPLRALHVLHAKNVDIVDQLLAAAKQFGFHCLFFDLSRLRIQSLVEFCRGNTHLKDLSITKTSFSDADSTISVPPQNGPQDSSAILALDKLTMSGVTFDNSSAATKFSNYIAHVTYPALRLGGITIVSSDETDDEDEKRIIVSKLIKPSVQKLTLDPYCRIEVMNAIEACTSVTRIELNSASPPSDFRPVAVQQKLQEIATRNLARFVASPCVYSSGNALLALMHQSDYSPTGRYMLARCLPGIPCFFEINESNDTVVIPPTPNG
jgi:hypothetical protein